MGWKELGTFLAQHFLFGALGAVVILKTLGLSLFSFAGIEVLIVAGCISASQHWRKAPGWSE